MKIPFNKPYLSGTIDSVVKDVMQQGKLSGHGYFTQQCQTFFEEKFGVKKSLLTNSCTSALEMCALLTHIQKGDEVILPSYNFVSDANAFALRGANLIFCDSLRNHPNIDHLQIESLITPKTKVIVVVHYAGVACDMEYIMILAKKYNLIVIEDAAHAIGATYTFSDGTTKYLGSIGHLATFSFHETKNITCGEGGMLCINDEQFIDRAQIIWEKGTNKVDFLDGKVNSYQWKDLGSSYYPSEISAAILLYQFKALDEINAKRMQHWNQYFSLINNTSFKLPALLKNTAHNAHIFYLICENEAQRQNTIDKAARLGIHFTFHYICLHASPYFKNKYKGQPLANAERFSKTLLRLPLFYELTPDEIGAVIEVINN